MIRTKFMAQACISGLGPDSNSTATELKENWHRFISLSYGLNPELLAPSLTQDTMFKEYESMKDLQLYLRPSKTGGIEVVGLPKDFAKDVRRR